MSEEVVRQSLRSSCPLVIQIFEKYWSAIIWKNGWPHWLQFEALYQANMRPEEVAWETRLLRSPPDTEMFRKISDRNNSRTGKNIWLKTWMSYQENMMFEEVARQSRPLSVTPDTKILREISRIECVVHLEQYLAEISDFIPGEHDTRGGGTTMPAAECYSWYRDLAKNF